jgi:hypothetical protein
MTSETLLMPAEPGTRKFTARVEKAGLGTIEVIEKATGAKPGETGVASAADLSAAAAGTAQGSWGKFARPARGDVLREVSRLLRALQGNRRPARPRDVLRTCGSRISVSVVACLRHRARGGVVVPPPIAKSRREKSSFNRYTLFT